MEMKAGYKQTEVGVIPEDWLDPQLQEITEDNAPICYGIVKLGAFIPNGVPVLVIRDLNQDYISDIYRSSLEIERAYIRSRVQPYDVLISVKGTTGRVGIVPAHFKGNISRDLARIRTRKDVDPKFVFQMLQSDLAKHRLTAATVGTTRMELSIAILKQVRIPLPPTTAEQEAIAEALSDADALIESLEGLIAKKRQVKQGAMQELLTGKRRLPEFSKKWETKKLGDVFEITAGGDFDPTQSSDVRDEHFPYPIYSNALTDKGLYGFSSYNNHQAGSITVTARGTLGNANYRDQDFTAIGRVIVLKPTQPLDGRFISEFINNRIEFVIESTGVPQLTAPQISKYEILFPEFPEQTAIAEILSDMDAEITALEGKLSKAREVKAGMMSMLLTGRIRLI